MRELCEKDSDLGTTQSVAPSSWWCSNGSEIQHSSRNLSFKTGISPELEPGKQLGFQFHEQDSSSTQSTGQSYHELASSSVGEEIGKPEEGPTQSTQSSQDLPNTVSYGTVVPFTYPDPHSSGTILPYGSYPIPMIHPQMMCMTPNRVPLPLDLPQDDPIYVNAKQYHAILRRRESRAKLEAQNKAAKLRRPYLHESRHRHAVNRVRGPGGRFLNVKNVSESKTKGNTDDRVNSVNSEFDQSRLTETTWEPEIQTTSSSGITNVSNVDNNHNMTNHQQEIRYPVYASHIGGSLNGG